MAVVMMMTPTPFDVEMRDWTSNFMDKRTEVYGITEVLPPEIHCHILLYLEIKELNALQLTCRYLNYLVQDNEELWKTLYLQRWLKKASNDFMDKYYRRDTEWKELYKVRHEVEKKYLKSMDSVEISPSSHQNCQPAWKTYLKQGKHLAKYETEDLPEFILLATIEEEQYKSAAALALGEKDKSCLGDIFYYWGRCIKDLSRDKSFQEKYLFLRAEEEKYKQAMTFTPNDSYVLYSWAINLRYQLEYCDGQQAIALYKESSKRYREALKNGYIEKYVLWGLGSLKLHMAKKMIVEGNYESANKFVDKAEAKYTRLSSLRNHADLLTNFSLMFNYSCIYACKSKLNEVYFKNETETDKLKQMCVDRLKECAASPEYKEYLTMDLLQLWYFDEFRGSEWFESIYCQVKPKKLTAAW